MERDHQEKAEEITLPENNNDSRMELKN